MVNFSLSAQLLTARGRPGATGGSQLQPGQIKRSLASSLFFPGLVQKPALSGLTHLGRYHRVILFSPPGNNILLQVEGILQIYPLLLEMK